MTEQAQMGIGFRPEKLEDHEYAKASAIAFRRHAIQLKKDNIRLRDIEAAARDLVALWKAQKVTGLPRSERNAAIEQSRERLIELLADGGAEDKS